ncbi:cullin-1 [Drosophila mauritiana]|uniref:Cullin-1 n=1 Tax=Drosophila mauritiana TaxID=7226 RepID=A0A6P8JY14_DROMA|nr:cullin-1 [Drosophila mauritiana]XP_033161877.1 cullin-1 [Drosophila mauritiana]
MNRHDRINDYINSMADLSKNILQVVNQIFDDDSSFDAQKLMHLYHLIYKQCTERNWNAPAQNNGRTLYIFLSDFLKERLQNIAMEMENRFDDVKPIRLIAKYVEHWVPYQRACEKLDLACYHFNRNWVKQERFEGDKNTYPIYRLAMMSWKKLVFEPSITILTAIRQILSQMTREDNKSLVYQVLQSIVELYANDEYQDVSLSSRIDKIFIDKVMDFYKSTTLHEFQKILVSNDYSDFKHFLKYACLAMPEIEIGKQFKAILKRHLAARLQETIKSLSGKDYIQAILGFRQGPLQQALRDHKRLADIVDEVCADEINREGQKIYPTRLLVTYANELMTKRQESEEAIIDELKQIVMCVEFLSDKDTFIDMYLKALRIRQINETSTSDGAESTMFSLLNKRFGDLETRCLLVQLRDVEQSRIQKSQFEDHLKSKRIKLGFDFRPKCFTNKGGFENFNLTLPDELQQAWEEFRLFYKNSNKSRIVQLNNELSSGEITCHLNQSVFLLEVSTLQMAVLMLFNRHERFTKQELVTALGVDLETLQEALKQIKFLVYSGPFIKVNMDFTSRKRRLILNKRLLTKRRKIEEKCDDLKLRRDKQVDAAIVRIMKGKKELEYSQLISHVYEELKDRVKPQVSSIKERIDDLVKREYLERCDNNIYRYL